MTPDQKKACDHAVKILKALAHPIRLKIIKTLMNSHCNVNHIEKQVDFSQSGVSQHLRILRLSGIIEPKREGKEICYKIVDKVASDIVNQLLCLENMQ